MAGVTLFVSPVIGPYTLTPEDWWDSGEFIEVPPEIYSYEGDGTYGTFIAAAAYLANLLFPDVVEVALLLPGERGPDAPIDHGGIAQKVPGGWTVFDPRASVTVTFDAAFSPESMVVTPAVGGYQYASAYTPEGGGGGGTNIPRFWQNFIRTTEVGFGQSGSDEGWSPPDLELNLELDYDGEEFQFFLAEFANGALTAYNEPEYIYDEGTDEWVPTGEWIHYYSLYVEGGDLMFTAFKLSLLGIGEFDADGYLEVDSPIQAGEVTLVIEPIGG